MALLELKTHPKVWLTSADNLLQKVFEQELFQALSKIAAG